MTWYGMSMEYDLPEKLVKAMKGELEARKFYTLLKTMAPDEEDKKQISGIHDDEVKHYNNFYNLYCQITGYAPQIPNVEEPVIPKYILGLKKALMDELDAHEFYKEIYLSTNNPCIRNIFFDALTDENEHAIRINYMYAKCRCR